ncbi:MAG TPA: ferrochelatase [Azospirillaceae bacterium]|nr:ferrochelatase [Azospirillaceae bacterium]
MTESRRRRIAVVLFNLGGPDRPEAVQPFLFNLFNDPSIIRAPNPLRYLLARLISGRRAHVAREIYAKLGGKSPLLENTLAQARALEASLWDEGEVKAFVAMRYWHPMAEETAHDVKDWGPDEVVLLPLYPQWSTTTSASSLRVWHRAAAAAKLDVPVRTVCCYPTEPGFVQATAKLLRWAVAEAAAHGRPRVLFSAHGLPEKVVRAGDPYQWQCERTCEAIVKALGIDGLDWAGCYQSRVGPLKWIGPSTDEEIRRAGRDGVPVVVVPMAFVSEHSETLVEIEEEYRHLAKECGVPHFVRVPAVGIEPDFVQGLANLVRQVRGGPDRLCSAAGGRLCPPGFKGCAHAPGMAGVR